MTWKSHSNKYKMRCLDCQFRRYGPVLTVSRAADKHSDKHHHHVQVMDPEGLLIHDMDIDAVRELLPDNLPF